MRGVRLVVAIAGLCLLSPMAMAADPVESVEPGATIGFAGQDIAPGCWMPPGGPVRSS